MILSPDFEPLTFDFEILEKENDFFSDLEFPIGDVNLDITETQELEESSLSSFGFSNMDLEESTNPNSLQIQTSSNGFSSSLGEYPFDDDEKDEIILEESSSDFQFDKQSFDIDEIIEVPIHNKQELTKGCEINFLSNFDCWIYNGRIKEEREKEFLVSWVGFDSKKDEWVSKEFCFQFIKWKCHLLDLQKREKYQNQNIFNLQKSNQKF